MAMKENRKLIARDVRPDSRNRVSLGAAVADLDENTSYTVYRDASGKITLEPHVSIPAAEVWLYKNKQALESVRRGLEEAGRGETKVISSFAKYAEDDEA